MDSDDSPVRRTDLGGNAPQITDTAEVRRTRYSDHDRARVEVAAATRELIAELASTNAETEVLHEATRLVGAARDLLIAQPHGRRYMGLAEGALTGGSGDLRFADFSPFAGPMSPLAPPLDVRIEGDVVRARVVYRLPYEGPPGFVHGGFIAAGFDEVLGFAQGLSGQAGMTGRLEISYRKPTPLNKPLVYEAGISAVSGRKVTVWGKLSDGDALCAEASGLFIAFVGVEKMMTMLSARDGQAPAG